MKIHVASNEGGIALCLRRWDPSSADYVPPTTLSPLEESARERCRERETFVPPDRRSALHHACTAPIRSDGCDRAARTKVSGSARPISSRFSPGPKHFKVRKRNNIGQKRRCMVSVAVGSETLGICKKIQCNLEHDSKLVTLENLDLLESLENLVGFESLESLQRF